MDPYIAFLLMIVHPLSSPPILRQMYKFFHSDGGTLIYTSIKNNANLNVLYEYILHRAYNLSLRFKPEAINEESIFIPLGFDNPTMIE